MGYIYFIDNTANTLSFQVKPGELDGPGGVSRNSDMRLYGMGALQWGEGVDENILRLTETFTVSAKELGDYNPYTQANDYDPDNDPILPKSEDDISPGHGITTPLNGQLWYNASDLRVYSYDANFDLTSAGYPGYFGRWLVVTGGGNYGDDPLDNPEPGTLWWNTSYTEGCLTNPQLLIYDPTHPNADVDGWVLIGEDFVKQCGDFMTGTLEMRATIDMTDNRIVNLADPVTGTDALNLQYADDRYVNVTGDSMFGELSMTGNRIINLGDAILSSDALNRQTGDDRYINVTGDSMTGWLYLRETIPTNDWAAVPVKMLRDEIDTLTTYIDNRVNYLNNRIDVTLDRANQKRVYIGTTRLSYSASRATVNYYVGCWASHYNSTYDASTTISQWRFVIIPNIERLRVSNGNPSHDSPGNLGDYGFVTYYSEVTTINHSTGHIQIELGSKGLKTDGTERAYSSRGVSVHRIYILGFPPLMRNYYGLPSGGGSVC